jgi:hypothetical protein
MICLMAAFLRLNWLALGSLLISLFAVWLSYARLRRESRPILHIYFAGKLTIENVGSAAAVDLTAKLLEPRRRSSGKLMLFGSVLRAQGGKANVSAWDWPKELEAEIRKNRLLSVEDTIMRLHGEEPPLAPDLVAQYLVSRPGGQLLAIRYRIADSPRTHVRLFRIEQSPEGGLPHFVRVRLATRVVVAVLEFLWRNHPQYREPFKFSAANAGTG